MFLLCPTVRETKFGLSEDRSRLFLVCHALNLPVIMHFWTRSQLVWQAAHSQAQSGMHTAFCTVLPQGVWGRSAPLCHLVFAGTTPSFSVPFCLLTFYGTVLTEKIARSKASRAPQRQTSCPAPVWPAFNQNATARHLPRPHSLPVCTPEVTTILKLCLSLKHTLEDCDCKVWI